MDEEGTSPSDYSQVAGPSRVMGGSIDDTNIDPDLRDEGHVVGLGRTRSRSRRAGVAGGPYAVPSPSQSPRYQQGQLTSISDPRMGGVLAQDTSAQGQSAVRFGQPSFGQTSFVQPYAQSRPGLAASSAFAASSTTALAQSTPSGSRPAAHRAATAYDRNTHAIQPPARPGVEYVRDYSGLPNARRTHSYPQYQADTRQTSPDSASSGSSQTWNPDPKDKSNGRMM
ncbi:hypothetical protein BDN67DRAFT_175297 [Paxillus ammoniavirescens]|nr:hypothetical protein BDN67DRAFT_175297 [Paxillus ammoniavirescens]